MNQPAILGFLRLTGGDISSFCTTRTRTHNANPFPKLFTGDGNQTFCQVDPDPDVIKTVLRFCLSEVSGGRADDVKGRLILTANGGRYWAFTLKANTGEKHFLVETKDERVFNICYETDQFIRALRGQDCPTEVIDYSFRRKEFGTTPRNRRQRRAA